MEDLIKLPARYKIRTFLKLIPYDNEKLVYVLKTDASTIRVIYKNNDKSSIQAIDPSGGPMLSVGSSIEGYKRKIKSIEFLKDIGWIIKF